MTACFACWRIAALWCRYGDQIGTTSSSLQYCCLVGQVDGCTLNAPNANNDGLRLLLLLVHTLVLKVTRRMQRRPCVRPSATQAVRNCTFPLQKLTNPMRNRRGSGQQHNEQQLRPRRCAGRARTDMEQSFHQREHSELGLTMAMLGTCCKSC